ncbi:MAG: xylulokinase [Phycisphaerae bacterium]|jgi:xylulokinase|nr:xylulokinase [Phycisphaerae bacterium]MDP7287888.1 xylulokinase [Phycisphaerae bacterium]
MPQYLLAHDIGTSGNKATLFDTDGKLVASHTSPYDTNFFNNNWAEQDPADWWRAVCVSSKALLADIAPGDVACIALSGQMMGCLPVSANGAPLRPSMIYCDQRAVEQADHLTAEIGPEAFYAIIGHRISASYSIEKLMWLKANEPDTYAATAHMLNAKDYVNFKLTGRIATDYSDASGTNAFDLNTFKWSDTVIEAAGIDPALLPEARPSTDILGTITAEASEATGLLEGTPVAIGGGDGSCAAVGVGCVRAGMAYGYVGSSSWIAMASEKPIVDEQMRTMNWAHVVPGYLHPAGTMQTAGSSYQWLKNEICLAEIAEADSQGVDPYTLIDAKIAGSPPGANGLIFLPYLMGERTPRWNPNARGAFIGLTLGHKRADMLRAVLEGVTYNLCIIADIFRAHVPFDSVTVIGGGAKGAVWRQMMADVYNCRIQKLNVLEEATSMGAAVTAGVAAGVFENFDVIERFVSVDSTHEPDVDAAAAYDKIKPIFEKSYHALVDVYEDLAEL